MSNTRLPTSNIQALCTGDEPEFMVGEVYGLRQWELKDFGHLMGHFGHYWPLDPSQANVATCEIETVTRVIKRQVAETVPPRFVLREFLEQARYELEKGILADVAGAEGAYLVFNKNQPGRSVRLLLSTLDALLRGEHEITVPTPVHRLDLGLDVWEAELVARRLPHTVAHPLCTCGFYAYTDWPSLHRNSNTGAGSTYVFGLVRGYGHVTVGEKGFRAEKAQIVALTWPHHYEAERLFYTDQNPDRLHALASSFLDDGKPVSYTVSQPNMIAVLNDIMTAYSDSHYAHWRQLVADKDIPLVHSFPALEAFIKDSGLTLGLQ